MEMQRGLSERDLQPWKISGHGAWKKGVEKRKLTRGKINLGKVCPGENFYLGEILTWGKINCGKL